MSGRTRVARVITRLNVGGPAIQAMLLTRRLDPERYETVLLCGQPGRDEGDMLRVRPEAGVHPTILPYLRREISLGADVRALVELVALFRRLRPRIVHTHMAKAGLLGRAAARLAGVPIVVHTFHGNVLRGYFGAGETALFRFLERLLGRLSSAVIAISPRQAEEIRALGIATGDRLVEIPLGLDLAPFLDTPVGRLRAELGVGTEVPLVGVVARLVPIKGIDVFLEAASLVARARADTLFVVIGGGEQSAALKQRARALGLGPHVRFLGWRADLPAIYADLDVVANTSHNEGIPVSLIEALAAGRGVVATAVGGTPDLLGDPPCGALVPDSDVAAVAEAILVLLGDPALRERLGRMGRERVYPEYDATTLLRRMDALYTRLDGSAP